MKKLLTLLFMAALTLTGCSKDDENSIKYVLTFEAVPSQYLAGPNSHGDNLYSDYGANQYIGYIDTKTALKMQINEAPDFMTGNMTREFWNGGVAISQWNDMTTDGYDNQCSVFYKNATTGFGGNAGSKTFGVVMTSSYAGVGSLEFTSSMERTFTSIYVTNGTYAALSMEKGDHAAKKFEAGDWFKVIITGVKANGSKSGTVECYLADFRTAASGGILKEWKKVDLTSLGKVNKLEFTFESSDTGEWGMNTPTYVCIDDIAFN